MGRELQKKKNRSSLNKVTKRRNPRIHKIKSFGSQIIAQNWDKNETLQQNYKRLGLTVKLNRPTGGVERTLASLHSDTPVTSTPTLKEGEARIERDADGNVLRVVYGKTAAERLDELTEADGNLPNAATDNGAQETTEVVKALMERAARGQKVERNQSGRETEWVARLVEKYGDDYRKMVWDKKLNPFQQSEGDIKKRVLKYKQKVAKQAGAEDAMVC